ncbi:MAG: PSD1 and planctomycete cytochrome C domain-containing protein [Acidobacteria bacterium]|nr:PSD1 and planctomycete cytochrome C domain-containing protein [Acidobacteriota bacterium]
MQPRLLLIVFVALATALPAAETIRFNRDIRPILSQNCFQCHGPDSNARQAGLRLDRREEALEAGAIVPGDTEKSKLVARLYDPEPVRAMPPVWSNRKLTDEQKSLLKRWVEQGAEYERHWAYIPSERPEAPAGPAGIDHLVNAKLDENGLKTVAEADRRTLMRRLSFDLIGLPPSADEARAFVNDQDPGAYEKLVDRLLDSPHFGERMAVYWLDLVRYADSVGFHSDVPINVYLYRDYVIRAFNENKPFDEFTRENLAGDLLPNPTDWQRVASAYNRLNRMTNEGGAQAEEYRAKYATDRVQNISTVWMGSTLGCAECHDHKFDPFAAKDFYQMASFFADVKEVGVYGSSFEPVIRVLSEDSKKEVASIQWQISDLRHEGRKLKADQESVEKFRTYLRERLSDWKAVEPSRFWNDCEHPDITGCEDIALSYGEAGFFRQKVTGEEKPREAVAKVESEVKAGRVTALLLEIFPEKGFDDFYLSEFEAELLRSDGRPVQLAFGALVPDRQGPESYLRQTLDGNARSGWQGNVAEEGPRRALWVLDAPLETKPGQKLRVTMIYNGRGAKKIAGRFRLSVTAADFPELPPSGDLRDAVLADGKLNGKQRKALKDTFRRWTRNTSEWQDIRRLERHRAELLDHADECLATEVSDEPRVVRILPRGDWMDETGEVVEPQTPHFLNPIAVNGERLTRLDLANWLVDRENPLTARVFVNRLWKMLFGTGLSKVLDDIGSQGESPVHQELLDWLAVEFMESGWDVKHVLRTMVLSETYRRSSAPSPELIEKDPYNRLHGRQTMRRLDAEFIRDSALRVSGLLNREMYGPGVRPYQPADYYQELNFPKREYVPDYNEDQFRRGVYTHWQRTFLHPSLMALDAPSREECTAERVVSNTPLQSLAMLNDPSYVEAARAFAVRILQSVETATAGRINFAFEAAFSREAAPEEQEVLSKLVSAQLADFRKEPARAKQLLGIGFAETPAAIDPVELAAWTGVARALMNKHEFVMRY